VAFPAPAPGLVISYAYLWRDQHAAGAREGRKVRPSAIVIAALDQDGDTVVYVAPITHQPPDDPRAVELPGAVKHRLGLDAARSWIVTAELNRFMWPGYDLRPVSRDKPDVFQWGFLPVEILEAVKRAVLLHRRGGDLTVTGRE